MTDRATRRSRSTTAASLALVATLAAVASTAGGASPPTGAPTLLTTARRGGHRAACVRLPGCQAEADRFKADYVDGRCLPNARTAQVEAAITVHEVFKAVVKAACCTTAAQRATLAARIAPLEAAGTCAAPYTNLPDYDPTAYACRPLAACAAVLDTFEADFVQHGCLPRGNDALDAVAKGLLEVLKDVEKAACCTARAQRRRLATELVVLGRASWCAGFAAAAARFAVRPPRAVGGGGGGARRPAAGTAAAAIAAGAGGAAAAAAAALPTAARAYASFDSSNAGTGRAAQCCGGFSYYTTCCSSWCVPVGFYLQQLITRRDCCVGALTWPKVRSCAAIFRW